MTIEGSDAVSVREPHRRRPLAQFAGGRVHAVAGIGHPERFFRHLQRAGLKPVIHAYPDHHRLAPADLAFAADDAVLMTEKDAVKCECWAGRNHWYVPVTAKLPEAMETALLALLARGRQANSGGWSRKPQSN